MKLIVSAIVDDDKSMIKQIGEIIREVCIETIKIDEFESGILLFQQADTLMYDIIFLDIDMPSMTGFELAEMLKRVNPNITIVFVSNLESLVFRSFEFNPFYFVRKRCLKEDITSAFNAYIKKLNETRDIYFFRTIDTERSVPTSEIIYFESMGHNIYIHTISDVYKLKREQNKNISMKFISGQFEPKGFIRVHKSYIINYKYIYLINRTEVILKNKERININPRKSGDIKNAYQKFLMMEA